MLVIGIDGGGTKTVARLADASSGTSLGTGIAGPANQRAVGAEMALQNLETAVLQAFAAAGLQRTPVMTACLGLAGADRTADRAVIQEWADHFQLAGQVVVVNDALPLLFAVSSPAAVGNPSVGTGIALICGTGSFAFGRNHHGQTARSGGWGYLLGDEGSAYWIGREALQAVTAAVDGRGPQTALIAQIQHSFHLPSVNGLITTVYGAAQPKSVIAKVAELVFSTAEAGDEICQRILTSAATHLCLLVTSLADNLQMRQHLRLVVTGGVLLNQPGFLRDVQFALQQSGLQCIALQTIDQPVDGAVAMAAQMALTGTTIL